MIYKIKDVLNNERLVIKINQIFHDFEAEEYIDKHPEIFEDEKESWNILFKKVRDLHFASTPLNILDIGTGTGFVPWSIADHLIPEDTVIASDISEKMLTIAKEKLAPFGFKKRFVKIEDGKFDVSYDSIDIITINSVLHHIPNVNDFLSKCERLLKNNGLIIIKHEPNIRFANNYFLNVFYKLLLQLKKKSHGTAGVNRSLTGLHKKVILELQHQGVSFDQEMTSRDLQSLVDIQSPTARGGLNESLGFDPFALKKHFTDAILLEHSIYGYLGKINENANFLRRLMTKIIKFTYPKDGYFFDVIIQVRK